MRATASEGCGARQQQSGGGGGGGGGVRCKCSFRSVFLSLFLFVILPWLFISATHWSGSQAPAMLDANYFNEISEIQHLEKSDYAIRNLGGCSIPDFDPFDRSYRRVFYRVGKPACSASAPVSFVRTQPGSSDQELVLDVDAARKRSPNYSCCYHFIYRHKTKRDQAIEKSKCHPIKTRAALSNTTEFIIVSCQNPTGGGKRKPKVWYKNAHALIPDKAAVLRRLAENRTGQVSPPVSVLLIGIDSISRLNFMRAMPKTARLLYDSDWTELRGYNKIGDNTYPNLMAVLTGMRPSDAYGVCKPTTERGLDRCPFVWKNFSARGYVTAYGEDLPDINTFNYKKSGFHEQPTDYYMRPYFLAMQSHMPNSGGGFKRYFCTGPVPAAQRVYDYALRFAEKFRDDPSFGLFWMNSFSHDDVNLPSAMDGATMTFFEKLRKGGILDASVVFFFSDHGIRFGKSRELFTGFYEERLPFFFAWFPAWFRERYPRLVEAFATNANRLTTPYDFHVTLLHLLSLAEHPGGDGVRAGTSGCPKSDSMFKPMSPKRTCEDACIGPHWCSCGDLVEYDPKGDAGKEMAAAVIDHLNDVELANQTLCSHLSLSKVLKVRTVRESKTRTDQYVVDFETVPGRARFEATVTRDERDGDRFVVQDQISRLNSYEGQSNCVAKDTLRKYCYCMKRR